MPKQQLQAFLEDVASAKAKGDAADAAVVTKLKALSADEFARVPRDMLNSLSNEQYKDIVATVAPHVELKEPEAPPSPAKPKRHLNWRLLPRWIVAVFAGLLLGSAILIAAISATPLQEWWSYSTPLSRGTNVATWPRCQRLTQWTDGCVYRVTRGLSWSDAASLVELPEIYLRWLNSHIQADPIPAGSDLTIWRQRFPLQEDR